jgi:hypothetical protein
VIARASRAYIGEMPDRPFLAAEWMNVAAITFAAEEERLRPRLPPGATLDTLEAHLEATSRARRAPGVRDGAAR